MDDVSPIALVAGSADAATIPVSGPTTLTVIGPLVVSSPDVDADAATEKPTEAARTSPAKRPHRRRTGDDVRQHDQWRPPDRIVDEAGRYAMTGYCRGYWYKLEKRGEAPKRLKLGARKIGWLLSELEGWLADRAAQRR